MAFTEQQLHDISTMLDTYVNENRPPEEMRKQVDLGWRIDKQSVFLFEIRRQWNDATMERQLDFARATWVQRSKQWDIYWMRGNLKWQRYQPLPEVGNLQRFLIEVEQDPAGCFRG